MIFQRKCAIWALAHLIFGSILRGMRIATDLVEKGYKLENYIVPGMPLPASKVLLRVPRLKSQTQSGNAKIKSPAQVHGSQVIESRFHCF